jgi:hypothetical protein
LLVKIVICSVVHGLGLAFRWFLNRVAIDHRVHSQISLWAPAVGCAVGALVADGAPLCHLEGRLRPTILPTGNIAASQLALSIAVLETLFREATAYPQLSAEAASRQRRSERGGSGGEEGAVVIGKADGRVWWK